MITVKQVDINVWILTERTCCCQHGYWGGEYNSLEDMWSRQNYLLHCFLWYLIKWKTRPFWWYKFAIVHTISYKVLFWLVNSSIFLVLACLMRIIFCWNSFRLQLFKFSAIDIFYFLFMYQFSALPIYAERFCRMQVTNASWHELNAVIRALMAKQNYELQP